MPPQDLNGEGMGRASRAADSFAGEYALGLHGGERHLNTDFMILLWGGCIGWGKALTYRELSSTFLTSFCL